MADVKTRHPTYTPEVAADWQLLRDVAEGARQVKKQGELYLPIPSGFLSHDNPMKPYAAYKLRAIVHDLLAPSISAMVGIIHAKETQIDGLEDGDPIWEDADRQGTQLEAFHRRITRQLLLLGRYGVLATAPEGGGDPYLAGYDGDAIINWDDDFYVLDESGWKREGFEWVADPRYRVLQLDGGRYTSTMYAGDTQQDITELEPRGTGGQPLPFVPFICGSAVDLLPRIVKPPLLGIANAIISAYQLAADWRWQLYMSGQETLVAINGEAPDAVGAGVVYSMKGKGDIGQPDLKYVSPSCSGIDAHERAISKQLDAAIQAGARMMAPEPSSQQESGEARKLRFASETASLQSVAQVSAEMLEQGLRFIARMKGKPDSAVHEIVVTPPADLLDSTMTAQEFAQMAQVWRDGAISWDTFYERGRAGGIFSPERDAAQEFNLLSGEASDNF